MSVRVWCWLFSCLGLGCVCASYYFYFPSDKHALELQKLEVIIDAPNRELNDMTVGINREVRFVVQNQSWREMRVIGFEMSCGVNCCILAKNPDDYPITIVAGGKTDACFEIQVVNAGTFHHSFPLYLDDGELHEITLSIRGIAGKPSASFGDQEKK